MPIHVVVSLGRETALHGQREALPWLVVIAASLHRHVHWLEHKLAGLRSDTALMVSQ